MFSTSCWYKMWCDVMWYDVFWCVMCCDVMWYVLWCDTMPWCLIMGYDMMHCDLLWCDILWCDTMYYDIPCAMMWCDVLRRDTISQDVIPVRCYNLIKCNVIHYDILYTHKHILKQTSYTTILKSTHTHNNFPSTIQFLIHITSPHQTISVANSNNSTHEFIVFVQ